jgi:hypothetical protein
MFLQKNTSAKKNGKIVNKKNPRFFHDLPEVFQVAARASQKIGTYPRWTKENCQKSGDFVSP